MARPPIISENDLAELVKFKPLVEPLGKLLIDMIWLVERVELETFQAYRKAETKADQLSAVEDLRKIADINDHMRTLWDLINTINWK